MKVVYNVTKPTGNRVDSVLVLCKNCSVPRYEPLKLNETYTVLLGSFLLYGGDKYKMLADEQINVTKIGEQPYGTDLSIWTRINYRCQVAPNFQSASFLHHKFQKKDSSEVGEKCTGLPREVGILNIGYLSIDIL